MADQFDRLMPQTEAEREDLRRQNLSFLRMLQLGAMAPVGWGVGTAIGGGIARGLPWAQNAWRSFSSYSPMTAHTAEQVARRGWPVLGGTVIGAPIGQYGHDRLVNELPHDRALWRALVAGYRSPEPPTWWLRPPEPEPPLPPHLAAYFWGQ